MKIMTVLALILLAFGGIDIESSTGDEDIMKTIELSEDQ